MTAPPQALEVSLRHALVPQKAFAYRRGAWLHSLGRFPGVETAVIELPAAVDRRIVATRVEELLECEHVVPAFVTAMIWGHGASNYGPFRTADILTAVGDPLRANISNAVLDRLHESIQRARHEGAVEGFRYLNNQGHIKGLGPAFFTKWLYFVTARGQERSAQAAPVLDQLVTSWLKCEAHIQLRTAKTPDYQRYVELLREWGQPHQLTPVEVEERIFRLIRSDGASAS